MHITISTITLAALLLVAVGSSGARAQYYSDPYYRESKASTVGESHACGLSDMVRSAGEANLRNSEAAKNYEDARSKNFDNRLKYTNVYFEMRRVNKEYRDANRKPRVTSEQLFRYARIRAPNQLSPSELDPLTGQIAWPTIFLLQSYTASRKQLDALFAKRAGDYVPVSPEGYREIKALTKQMHAELKKNLLDYPPSDYIRAKKFIDSLRYAARFPPT